MTQKSTSIYRARRIRSAGQMVLQHWQLYVMLILPIIFFIIFKYIPMLGIQIAFKDYKPRLGIWASPFTSQNGFKHFLRFFNSRNTPNLIWNTVSLSLYGLFAGFPLPIILSLMMNELRSVRYRKTLQFVTYAPHFLSTVVLVGMFQIMLEYPSTLVPGGGIVNTIIMKLGGEPVKFLTSGPWFPHVYVWSGIWQNLVWSSIIYMAALAGIDPELYEAAMVDGATKPQRILHISLPGLIPTATVLLIMNMGQIMNVGFEKVFLLQTGLNLDRSQTISTYVYSMGLLSREFSFSTAIDIFNSVINLILIVTVNGISRRVSETSLW